MERNVTQFQSRVYKVCEMIPRGRVSTYKLIALHLKTSPRAVGQALRRNPFAPAVPCHRVVNHQGLLHGFYGKTDSDALTTKKKLLTAEGIPIVDTDGQGKFAIDRLGDHLFDDFSS